MAWGCGKVKVTCVCALKGNKIEQACPGMRINDLSNCNYYYPCSVVVLRHKILILPDSEYAMKIQVPSYFLFLLVCFFPFHSLFFAVTLFRLMKLEVQLMGAGVVASQLFIV